MANRIYSKLDQHQILQRVMDEEKDALRVEAEVTATLGTVECVIDSASGDNIAIKSGSNTLKVNVDGSIDVNAAVSGTVSVSNFPASQAVTFAQPALVAGTAIIGKVGIDQTIPGTTNLVHVGAPLPVGTNKIGAVDIAGATATIKGTQGTRGVPIQALKDSGRSVRTITLDSFAVSSIAETLNTMSYSADNGVTTSGTSYNVTAGKRFRIQAITATIHTVTGNATAANVIVRLRANNAGAALVSSPVQAILVIPGVAGANSASTPATITIPDGWEFAAGAGIGVTTTCSGFAATTAAPKVNISIIGYEY